METKEKHEACYCEHEHHEHECRCHEHECGCHEHHHEHKSACGCHHHEHGEQSTKKQIIIIAAATLLLIAAYVIERNCNLPMWQLLLVYLVPYLLVGHHTIGEAIEGIMDKDPFNENFLMTVATLGALAIGFMPGAESEFPEAVFVMLFFQVGELFEGYAEGKSRKSISHLMDIRPDTANIEETLPNPPCSEGEPSISIKTVSPDEVAVGSIIMVRPGEKIPLDGTIIEGRSALNTIALTGESMPREVKPGNDVISGCINLSGVLRIKTSKTFGESTVSKIINLVENAAQHKSSSETFITRFARVYTPIVVFAALALAVIPPFFMGESYATEFPVWLHRALIFLVVSCPCALVISVPLTFFGGIGGASRRGILIKGANYIDQLAAVNTVVFDKTGTLTNGTFRVVDVKCQGSDKGVPSGKRQVSAKEIIHLAALVEQHSTHPIAVALREADTATGSSLVYDDYEEIAGHGIRAKVDGEVISVGNIKMMDLAGARPSAEEESTAIGTVIYVARGNQYLGHIVITDTIKDDAREAIDNLKGIGVENTVMLTGDRDEVAKDVANKLGLSEYHAGLLPADKVSHVEQLISKKDANARLAFVGDGINDAPVLARADVGIAMGAMGSDAAIEAADVVLMNDTPSSIATAIHIARRTIGIARQNVVFAIGVKVAVLILATFGLSTMWMAVFADVGVTVLAVLNAMRALKG